MWEKFCVKHESHSRQRSACVPVTSLASSTVMSSLAIIVIPSTQKMNFSANCRMRGL